MEQLYLTQVRSSDIQRVVGKIKAAVAEEDEDAILMACLSIALIFQCPDITHEQLAKGVRGCSEWIALYTTSPEELIDPKKVN